MNDVSRWEYLVFHTVRREGVLEVVQTEGPDSPLGSNLQTRLHEALAAVGEHGWELAGIGPLPDAHGARGPHYIFKRPKRQ
jgi:hypothetical protein